MIIYHGTDHVLSKPLFGFGKNDNDYGSGFYTTESPEKAAEWAINNGSDTSIVNKYEIDTTGLKVLYLDEYGVLAWVAEIVNNRGARGDIANLRAEQFIGKYKIDTDSADIIIGYRADDSYTDVVDAFLNNSINIDEVERLFRKGELGKQVFIKSKEAFNRLQFRGYEEVYEKDYNNDSEFKARSEVSKFLRNRMSQIIVNNFEPSGITVTEALERTYAFNKDYKYYEEVNNDFEPEIDDEDEDIGDL